MANAPDRYERFMVQEGTLKYAFASICRYEYIFITMLSIAGLILRRIRVYQTLAHS